MKGFFQVAVTSEQVDTKKQEKEEVVDRLTKMEHELKVLAVSENLTDQVGEKEVILRKYNYCHVT